MAEILRSWCCLNPRCETPFDAWESCPTCPACGCVRVQWVPGGGHVAGTAKAADAELRALADHFNMLNMNSAERGRAAKIVKPQPAPAAGPAHHFAPGFSAPVSPAGATCTPSASKVDFKATVGIGRPLSHSRSVPGVHTATAVEASHRPAR